MRKVLLVCGVLAAIAFVIRASPAMAVDINFGTLTPAPACGPVVGVGSVCAITEVFTLGPDIITANGFTGAPAPGTGNTNLTLKPFPLNTLGESGLGINLNPGPACTDPECEISPPQSVTAVAGGTTLITDAIIGSIQAGETFNFFTQNTLGGAFVQLNGAPIGQTCIGPGFSVAGTDQCRWDAPTGQTRFGVAVQAVAGDELLSSVSVAAPRVPEPASVLLLGSGLLALGLLQGRRRKA